MPRPKGFICSAETIEKMRLKKLGTKHTEEHNRNMSLALKGRQSVKRFFGAENQAWKGDNVGNKPLHKWVRKYLPKPELCQICHKEPTTDLANMTGVYNRDFKNWQYLCRKCHFNYDWGNLGYYEM